jgi:hypothetical protein
MRGALLRFVLIAIISVPQLLAQSTSVAGPLKCNQDTTDWSGKDDPGAIKAPAEQCAWARISAGQIATFTRPELKTSDRTKQEESRQSRESRRLRGEFIKEILREKWSKQIPAEGIRISGAIIDKLDLDNMSLDQRFECHDCDFEGGARFLYVRPKWFIDLQGSHIIRPADRHCTDDESDDEDKRAGILNLGGLASEGSVLLNKVKADCAITLNGAKIKENLILQNTDARKLQGKEAQIAGRATIEYSRFMNLNFEKARIGRLAITDLNDSNDDVKNGAEVSLDGASIDRDMDLQGGFIKSVSASNMTVGGKVSIGDLRREEKGEKGVWPLECKGKDPCDIKMHNSNVANVEVQDGLPAKFDVTGLTYKSFALLTKDGKEINPNKDDQQRYVKWLQSSDKWLQSSEKSGEHSPQPYLQLANVFKVQVFDDQVDQIHIWERDAAWEQANWMSWPWETLKWGLIGYGYRKWLAFVWIGVFLVLGWIIVRRSKVARKHHFGFTYSFDMLLPIVRLREAHYTTELELPYRAYFYFHRIIGYLLGLLLLAALSGLTNVS